ncbi:MAG TPA: hypothetical protein ACFYEK_15990 [Candidatus Wunengus sp. YC60]|uniref:hypothetical protein n=1 Tax=Candidatus Wunengus sp. YC60 TaxID=3367697 RepID=UPI00402824EF
MSGYLKEEAHYNDLYDLFTIEDCLRTVTYWRNAAKNAPSAESSNLSQKEKDRHFSSALNMDLFIIKGERYRRKSSTIQEWIVRDRGYDERLDNTQEPQNIACPQCGAEVELVFKDLHDGKSDYSRVLFFFECPKCKKRKGLFDNGEPFISHPQHCPRCKKEVKTSCIKKGETLKWITSCKSCGYKEVEVDDFEKTRVARLGKEAKERELLKKHRAEFCLSSVEGQEYIESMSRLEAITTLLRDSEKKRADPDYQKVANLKRLSVVELEKLISETIGKEKYIKLMLEKPDIDRHVIVPFTVQDADSSRKEYDSVHKLQRIIKKALEGTNWRLMSEGVHYRLGYLSGKLKGYEHEEDLLQLIKSVPKKP